jgi:hypothetical protein
MRPLCNQEEPGKVPKMLTWKRVKTAKKASSSPTKKCRNLQKAPKTRDEISAGLGRKRDPEQRGVYQHRALILMKTRWIPRHRRKPPILEAHDSEAPDEKTDAEAISKEVMPRETELLTRRDL